MKPPITKTIIKLKVPNVFAMIGVLPVATSNQKKE